jgi:hypothetical protein
MLGGCAKGNADDSNQSISILSSNTGGEEPTNLLHGEYTPTDQLIKLCQQQQKENFAMPSRVVYFAMQHPDED